MFLSPKGGVFAFELMASHRDRGCDQRLYLGVYSQVDADGHRLKDEVEIRAKGFCLFFYIRVNPSNPCSSPKKVFVIQIWHHHPV